MLLENLVAPLVSGAVLAAVVATGVVSIETAPPVKNPANQEIIRFEGKPATPRLGQRHEAPLAPADGRSLFPVRGETS